MSKLTRNTSDGQAGHVAGNGRLNGTPYPAGPAGSILFLCVDRGLADELRKVLLPAIPADAPNATITAAVERQAVVVCYLGPGSSAKTQALQLASWIEREGRPERVGTLDLVQGLGFPGSVGAFLPRYTEGEWTGPTFIMKADLAANWRERAPIPLEPEGDHEPVDAGDHAELAKLPRTDVGNGERLIARYGRDLRYCHPWCKWLVWDGRRWKADDTAAARRMAKATARALLDEAATVADDDERKAAARWWHESEGSGRINAMLAQGSSERGVPVLPDALDRDPMLLNVPNGTVDLTTGKLRDHRREDLITCLAPVAFDPSARCPIWDAFLATITAGDEELAGFLRRWSGLCLTGRTTEHLLPILYGCGANGKTTFLTAILEILGEDYAISAPPGLLIVKRGETHPTERAVLFKKRLVVDMESAEDARLNENFVKQLTGGDKITARRMREDFWSFTPTHKVVLGTNHKPEIRETKAAIWRRVKLVPFTVTIPEPEQDKDLPNKLRAEYPGILAWCVRGCLEWQRGGLNPPKAVADATEEYRAESDLLAEFLASECVVNPQLQARATPLYDRYRQFIGSEAVTQRAFGKALGERGFQKRTNNGTVYLGLGLRAEATDGGDDRIY